MTMIDSQSHSDAFVSANGAESVLGLIHGDVLFFCDSVSLTYVYNPVSEFVPPTSDDWSGFPSCDTPFLEVIANHLMAFTYLLSDSVGRSAAQIVLDYFVFSHSSTDRAFLPISSYCYEVRTVSSSLSGARRAVSTGSVDFPRDCPETGCSPI